MSRGTSAFAGLPPHLQPSNLPIRWTVCPDCGGSGQRATIYQYSGYGQGIMPCPRCSGQGKVGG